MQRICFSLFSMCLNKISYVENGLLICLFFNQGQFLDSSSTSCLHGLLYVSHSSASSYLECERSFCCFDSPCGSLRATLLLGAQEVPWRLSFHPLSFTSSFISCTRIFYRWESYLPFFTWILLYRFLDLSDCSKGRLIDVYLLELHNNLYSFFKPRVNVVLVFKIWLVFLQLDMQHFWSIFFWR